MKNWLKQKVGIVLSATLLAVMFSAFTTPLVASAADCSLDFQNPAEVATKSGDLSDADLMQCITKAKTEAENCSTDYGELAETLCPDINNSLNTLQLEEQARIAITPIGEFIKKDLEINDMFNLNNRCITDNNESVITVIVEEAIESDLVGTNDTEVRNCVRNTFCVVNPKDGKGIQCATTLLNAEAGCSSDAIAAEKLYKGVGVEDKAKKASLHCQPVQVFISKTGTDLLFLYIGTIYRWAASITGIIAVLVMVISGIQISAAAGDQQAVTNARNRIIQSLGGLALLFLSGIILYTINPTFFTAG